MNFGSGVVNLEWLRGGERKMNFHYISEGTSNITKKDIERVGRELGQQTLNYFIVENEHDRGIVFYREYWLLSDEDAIMIWNDKVVDHMDRFLTNDQFIPRHELTLHIDDNNVTIYLLDAFKGRQEEEPFDFLSVTGTINLDSNYNFLNFIPRDKKYVIKGF